jgi:hypothetical protein
MSDTGPWLRVGWGDPDGWASSGVVEQPPGTGQAQDNHTENAADEGVGWHRKNRAALTRPRRLIQVRTPIAATRKNHPSVVELWESRGQRQ